MKAADVMVRDPVTVTADADISLVIKLLLDHDISAVPVVDDDRRVIGIVSEADLLRREGIEEQQHRPWWVEAITPATKLAEEFAKSHAKKVEELMTTEVISADENASLSEIAGLLERYRIKRVPILKDGRLVGIVSRSNLLQGLASLASEPSADHETDRAIRADLLDQLAEQSWTDFGNRNVIVVHGTVHLWGLVDSPEERKALVVLAENIPGAKAVVDEMIPAYS